MVNVRCGSKTEVAALRRDVCFEAVNALKSDIAPCPKSANSGHHQACASMQGKPKQVRAYETTPEPSTRGVVDIT